MKNKSYKGAASFMCAGFVFGLLLNVGSAMLNYLYGFKAPWFSTLNYSSDFLIILFSPIYLSLIFGCIGWKIGGLFIFNSLTDDIAQINEGIVITDVNRRVLWVSEGFIKTHGFELKEIKGKMFNEFICGPSTNMDVVKIIVRKLEKGENVEEELLTYHKNGEPIWISISIKPILNKIGQIHKFIAVHKNINIRKTKELSIDALYTEIGDYKFALDQSSSVIIFDLTGKIIKVNNNFCDKYELEANKILGRNFNYINSSMHDYTIATPIWNALKEGLTWKGELVNRNAYGKESWSSTTIVPLLDKEGKPHHFLSIEKDITSRKILASQLEINKNKLQRAMEIAMLGSWEIDANEVLTISDELRKIYHLPLEGAIELGDIYKNIHPEDIDMINAYLSRAKSNLQNIDLEFRYTIDEELHYMTSANIIQFNNEGEFVGIFGTVQDITSFKLIMLALKKSEKEKAVVFDNTQSIICIYEMDGTLIDINAAAEKITGYSKKEVKGLNIKLFVTNEDNGILDEFLGKLNINGTANGKMYIITKTGEKRLCLYQNNIYENNGGKPYVIVIAIDITDSIKAKSEIENQQQFISEIINNGSNIIFMLNETGQIILANPAFKKHYSHYKFDLPFIEKLASGKDDIFFGKNLNLLEMEEGHMIQREGNLTDALTGRSAWYTIIIKCFKSNNGSKYILFFGMDITSRYLLETDLIQANALVEKSLKAKDEFISNMNAELRSPLNAIIGFTGLLSETTLDFEQKEFIEIIQTASKSLLTLINNVMDLSKIESNTIVLKDDPMDITYVINDVIKTLEPEAKLKDLLIRKEFDKQLPITVLGSKLRLSQILLNLLGNAIKFTDSGVIDISCKIADSTDDKKIFVSFVIKDTGIGISAENQTTIFERFAQASNDTQKLYGGTGIGLNISQSIIKLYGGTLTMESKLGEGSTFYFTLPFQKYTELVPSPILKNENSGILTINIDKPIHILLAEDNMITAMLAIKILTKKGFTIHHVTNGVLAVQAVQEQIFDVILMDIKMPVMNGIDSSKKIRKLKLPTSKIPIIAITSYALHGEMQNCYKSGMNGYLLKPFIPSDLFNTIIEVVKR